MQVLLGNGESGFGRSKRNALPPTVPADALNTLVVHATATDLDGEPVSFDISWSRNGFSVPDLEGAWIITTDRLEPGQTWIATVTASDPWGLSTILEAEIEIANVPPTAMISTSPNHLLLAHLSHSMVRCR